MKVVIIEDEAPAADRLKKMLAATGREIEVVAVLDTLAGARAWFGVNGSPDLIFMDIQLSDGLSLDLVRGVGIGCPVIWVTAYDDYWQEAFEYNGQDLLDYKENKFRDKFLVRRGTEFVSIRVEEIAFFYASHKLVCLVRKDGAKFILDHSLAEIENQIDGSAWFRVNRKYLVCSAAIRKVSALAKSKLKVQVAPGVIEDMVVSSENSAAFKKWFGK